MISTDPAHRKVTLNPSLLIQPLGVRDRANGFIHLVVGDALKKGKGPLSFSRDFSERGLVNDPGLCPDGLVLLSRVFEPVRKSPSQLIFRCDVLWGKPIGPLPTRFFPKDGSHLFETMVKRAHAKRPGRTQLFIGP